MAAVPAMLPLDLVIIAVALFGLIFGSFITALSYRLPRGISIAKGRSACPACGTTLGIRDLIPVISWLMNRGSCRYCGTEISWRYPAIECATAVLFIGAALAIDEPVRLALVLGATPLMVALAVVDIEYQRLPNVLLAILAVFAIALRVLDGGEVLSTLIAAAAVFAFALSLDFVGRRFWSQGLGVGDAKLMAIMAIALPLPALLLGFCLAGAFGLATVLLPAQNLRRLSFGPALLSALWIGLVAL